MRRIAHAPDPYTPEDLAPLAGEHTSVPGHDGVSLHVVDAGAGQPVVLVHGLTASTRFWTLAQRPLLEQDHRVVAFDQRGHGGSGIGNDGVDVETLGRDLATVLEALDVRGAVVVGHSLGGVAVQSLLVHRPAVAVERVAHAVIACSLARNRPEGPLLGAAPGIERLLAPGGPDAVATLTARGLFGIDAPAASLIDLGRDILAEHDPALLAAVVRGIRRFDLRPGLPGVGVPVTVVAAGRDRLTPPRYSREIVELLPSCDEHWFPRAGHLLPWEQPAELVRIITEAANAVERSPVR